MVGFLRQLAGVLVGSLVTLAALGYLYPDSLPIAAGQRVTDESQLQVTGIAAVEADAPNFINYQGQLFNPSNGVPYVNAPVLASFRIYRDAAGTQQVYREDKTVTTNVDGFFTTAIGDTNRISDPYAIFNGQELFLGVVINGQALLPLQRINYVPYAQWARTAGGLGSYRTRDFAKIVAFGVVDGDGDERSGRGYDSSRGVVDGQSVYLIDLNGADHSIDDYTTVITPTCNKPVMFGVGTNADGRLIVDMFDQAGARTECRFEFMVFDRE